MLLGSTALGSSRLDLPNFLLATPTVGSGQSRTHQLSSLRYPKSCHRVFRIVLCGQTGISSLRDQTQRAVADHLQRRVTMYMPIPGHAAQTQPSDTLPIFPELSWNPSFRLEITIAGFVSTRKSSSVLSETEVRQVTGGLTRTGPP
ncbi:hypothetical protein HCH54_005253 [Aspergillus fumigatus]